jgi:hypothetical protein
LREPGAELAAKPVHGRNARSAVVLDYFTGRNAGGPIGILRFALLASAMARPAWSSGAPVNFSLTLIPNVTSISAS